MSKEITFKMDQQSAQGLISILGKLPTETNVYPLLVTMVSQFNDQLKEDSNATETGS